MLTGNEHGPTYMFKDVQCSVAWIDDRARASKELRAERERAAAA